jgi:RNA polymerase sigma factor (sigma-70 family)
VIAGRGLKIEREPPSPSPIRIAARPGGGFSVEFISVSSQPIKSREGVFATTRWSVVLTAGRRDSSEAAEALNWLCARYWPAVFLYVRRWAADPESARDLTQAFFEKFLEKEWISAADRDKGRFRTFLLTMVKRFLADQHDRSMAQKRGGGVATLSLDQLAAEENHPFEPAGGRSPDQEFDRRWAHALLEAALRRLETEAAQGGHAALFDALQSFLSGGDAPETLAEIGQRFDLGTSAVKMRLHRWRTRYRELIREEIAHTVPRLADLDAEMRHLLAALGD